MSPADDDRDGLPPVSVVTIVRGRRSHLEALAAGVARSRHRPSELVVVAIDDEIGSLHEARDVPVRVHDVDSEGGPIPLARARNLAIEAARGPIVVLLDVDCVPSRGLIGAMARVLAADDVIAMAPVGYLRRGAEARGRDDAWLEHNSRFLPTRPRAPLPGEPCDHRGLWSLAFGARRGTLLERVGGFDPAYVGYGAEDTDLGFRAREAGVELVWSGPEPAFHQHHRTLSPPAQHLEAIIDNAHRFRQRWGVWPMEGWLADFRDRGWIDWDPGAERARLRRLPRPDELAALEVD
ncbi:glycosyltransferase family 2 protein [Thermoleophilia bacterium SCSIO 60948]|nr:glycosyltransferase family 2 protein [Thermoleophilia bacterium SCSIO 60948]